MSHSLDGRVGDIVGGGEKVVTAWKVLDVISAGRKHYFLHSHKLNRQFKL